MTADLHAFAPAPVRRGGFQPGNPGRVPGSKNRLSRETLNAVQGLASEAIAALRLRLTAGDMRAVELVLEHCLPKGRTIDLQSTDPYTIADAMAAGDISPDEAARMATVVDKLKSIEEVESLRTRLEDVEAELAKARK